MTPQADPPQSAAAGPRRLWDRLEPVRRVRRRFEADTRALAAFRIAVASLIIIDLLYRAGDIGLFYTNQGAYPIAAYESTYTQYTGYSIHALSGDLWFQQFMFVVAGFFALLFLLGYRTRVVGLISLILLFSLHARNPAVLNGGDRLFRILIVLAVLAPTGERWSVDALRRGSARERVANFGTAAVILQPVIIFTSNAILKHNGENWYAGDALEIALLNDSMRFYLGNVIVQSPELMTVLNYGWVTLLAGSSLFLLATAGRARAVAALVYLSAFVGMMTAMAVGLFPLLLMSSVLPFLTTPFWDFVAARVPTHWAARLPDRTQLGPFSKPPVEKRLAARLRERGHLTLVAFPRSVLTVIGLLVIVWMLLFAAADVNEFDVPDQVDYDHLDQQSWGLYAPDPSEGYNWYVVEAHLSDGQSVDAISGGEVDFDRPPDGSEAYDTFRHRKFMRLVANSGDNDTDPIIAERYALWACDQASDRDGQQVENVTVHKFYQSSPLDGEYEEPVQWTVIQKECPTS